MTATNTKNTLYAMKQREINEVMKDIRSFAKALIIVGENVPGAPIEREEILLVGKLLKDTIKRAEKKLRGG